MSPWSSSRSGVMSPPLCVSEERTTTLARDFIRYSPEGNSLVL